MKTSLAIVQETIQSNQKLFTLLRENRNYEVLFSATTGQEMLRQMQLHLVPDVVLIHYNLLKGEGAKLSNQLKHDFPKVKVLALSTTEVGEHIVKLIRNGVRGFLPKQYSSVELHQALEDLLSKEYFYSDFFISHLVRSLNPDKALGISFSFRSREYEFLRMACSDLTYAEIADKMCVSTRTVDGYRESLFQKMNVKSRVGMAIEAIRWGLVEI